MILDAIPVSLPADDVIKHLRLGRRSDGREVAEELLRTGGPLIAPKIFFRVANIEAKEDDSVRIEGVRFSSRVLRKNLDRAERTFPFVMTVGRALEQAAVSSGDLLRQYYLEALADSALRSVGRYFEDYLKKHFGLDQISSMSPGSLPDWPVTEQRPLFALLGDPEAAVGVRLTDSLLMIPRKSVSGIYFPTEVSFFSCQLCDRERCPGRKAAFDKALQARYGLPGE